MVGWVCGWAELGFGKSGVELGVDQTVGPYLSLSSQLLPGLITFFREKKRNLPALRQSIVRERKRFLPWLCLLS